MRSSLADSVARREFFGWAMYDFANSGYTTVVITAVFNAYFVGVVAAGQPWATLAWTSALSVSYALAMLLSPLVGAYADAHAAKKRLLAWTTAACVLFTATLYGVGPGDVALGVLLLILSNVAYSLGETLVAAFLPELARGEAVGRVSGWGWSLGYFGGLLTLGACLAYVQFAQSHGATAAEFVPVTMLITAAVFALASLPTFLFLRERALPQAHPHGVWRTAFGRLGQTLHHVRRYQDLFRFLLSVVFYSAGIQAVIVLAAVYAQEAMGFSTQDSIKLILVVNVTAALGAFFLGHVQDRLGHRPTLSLTLLGWLVMIYLAYTADTPQRFWLAANVAGLCLGASQSIGRALVGLLSPASRRAEFFGLWGLAVRLSAILGPMTYGLLTWLTHNDHRLALLLTGGYFLAGLVLLWWVNIPRGLRAAVAAEEAWRHA
ncbi:MAG: MFS transporter [Pseudomonadota bacterium]